MDRNIFIFIMYILLIYCVYYYYINMKTTINIKDNIKYLTYLPHSGFHNQRIEMENALLLSYILNRTLLLPKANLGNSIPWDVFDNLNITIYKQDVSMLFSWKMFFNMALFLHI